MSSPSSSKTQYIQPSLSQTLKSRLVPLTRRTNTKSAEKNVCYGVDLTRLPTTSVYVTEEKQLETSQVVDEGYEEVPHLLQASRPPRGKVSREGTRSKTRSVTVPVYGQLRVSAIEYGSQGGKPTRASPLREENRITVPLYGAMFIDSYSGSSDALPSQSRKTTNSFYGRITL